MDPTTSISPKFNTTTEECKYHADNLQSRSMELDKNFTITDDVLYRNESDLNDLEKFVKDILKKGIEDSLTEIYIYSVMFLFGVIGNIFVLFSLYKNDRKSRRRENTLFIHLSLVDLLIVMVILPVEVYWKSTFVWELGSTVCKLFQFFKNYFM